MTTFPDSNRDWATEYAWRYLFTCWLYYHADHDGVVSPIDDARFDNMQAVLQSWWDLTPEWFRALPHTRERMKTDAHGLPLTENQKLATVAWAKAFTENWRTLATSFANYQPAMARWFD